MASRKPENGYISSVNRALTTAVYREKTSNPFRKGMPDMYYEGDKGSLWIEFKWRYKIIGELCLTDRMKGGFLSHFQSEWLKRAHACGQRVGVIVGSPDGGVILPNLMFQERWTISPATLCTPKEVAQWIQRRTMWKTIESS